MGARTFSATSGVERPGWRVLLGLVVVPALIAGTLTWALSTPVDHLDRVTAAIVNDDEPVTVNGQTTPLGRQFAAGLIDGTGSGAASNFTWVLTNDDEAADGLRSSRYAAVVTIPKSFSADATSDAGAAGDARQATIHVATTPTSAFLDPVLTRAVTTTATTSLNRQLVGQYLSQVYSGFNTINQQIAQAASGASSLASGASSLDDGAGDLESGAGELADGAATLDSGAQQLATGLSQLAAASRTLPAQTRRLATGAEEVADALSGIERGLDTATTELAAAVDVVCADRRREVRARRACARAERALRRVEVADRLIGPLSAGARDVADGNERLADAMPPLVDGITESDDGAGEVAAGADSTASGAESLASGAEDVAGGAAQVDQGAAQLNDGLSQAVQQIPTYSDDDITTLSSIVPQPVLAQQSTLAAGAQSVPFYCVLALWIGGLVTALARQAVPTRRLLTATSSWRIGSRSMLESAGLGAVQGVLVALVVLPSTDVGRTRDVALVAAAIAVGAVFALANQGLAAAFGAAGRLIALMIALVAVAAGLSSTVSPAAGSVAALMPTTPATSLLTATLTGRATTAWEALAVLLLVAAGSVALVLAGIATRRHGRVVVGSASATSSPP
ncbi:MAG: YhgE/Pip family protein [Aeromicrobium sp.]